MAKKSNSRFSIDKQLDSALKIPEVRKAYAVYQGDKESFMSSLRGYIETENSHNENLARFASYLDRTNKALVPVDAALDVMSIGMGVGTAAKATLTLAKLPGYLAYNAYYLGKTGDLSGTLGNTLYEATSWFLPGSIPHLIGKYAKQASYHSVKEGSRKFLDSLTRGGLENKLIQFPGNSNQLQKAA